jgi:galactokinase
LESIKSSAALTPYDYQSLLERLQQFIEESTHIIPAAGDALLRGDMQNFAKLVDRSQRYAEDLLKNQIPETIFLARRARELGAAASSAFGGGFGGAVWAIVRNDALSDFLAQWSSSYASAFPERISKAEFFPTDPGPAAFWLEQDF